MGAFYPSARAMKVNAPWLEAGGAVVNRVRLPFLILVVLILAAGFRDRTHLMLAATDFLSSDRALAKNLASATAAPRAGSTIWSADMETGDLSQWSLPDVPGGPNTGGGVFTSGIGTATDARLAHMGHHSAKLSITTPSVPTSGIRLFRWKEPHVHPQLYYSAWYYFPRRYVPDGDPSWWNVFGWKSKHSAGNDPFFALNVGSRANGAMYFYLYDENTKASYDQELKVIPERQWVRVEAFYICAGDKTGHVTFWQDGVQILDVANVQTRYPDGGCEWSLNNYSSSLDPRSADIYVDDAAICTGGRCP
jgi:hypothetical protein